MRRLRVCGADAGYKLAGVFGCSAMAGLCNKAAFAYDELRCMRIGLLNSRYGKCYACVVAVVHAMYLTIQRTWGKLKIAAGYENE